MLTRKKFDRVERLEVFQTDGTLRVQWGFLVQRTVETVRKAQDLRETQTPALNEIRRNDRVTVSRGRRGKTLLGFENDFYTRLFFVVVVVERLSLQRIIEDGDR